MKVIILNDNNNIINILNGIDGGKERKCILTDDNIERLSPIIRLAHNLELENKQVYIQVKFDSVYSPRPKRLEIVSVDEGTVDIYKFSRKSSFEKECIELQRVIDELRGTSNHTLRGYVVLSIKDEDVKPITERIAEISTDISIHIVQ